MTNLYVKVSPTLGGAHLSQLHTRRSCPFLSRADSRGEVVRIDRLAVGVIRAFATLGWKWRRSLTVGEVGLLGHWIRPACRTSGTQTRVSFTVAGRQRRGANSAVRALTLGRAPSGGKA